MSKILNQQLLIQAANELAHRIPQFGHILEQFGLPPLWDRPAGFSTLLYIILEQQVSLASAKATFNKLQQKLQHIDPDNFLTLTDYQLKAIGFSRQKTEYGRTIAQNLIDGQLDLGALSEMPDADIKHKLMSVKGIGHWTSDIYLLMVLLRADVWPHGDRALAVAAREVFALKSIPDYPALQKLAVAWKPWRSVAARMLWNHYLNTPRKK